MKCFSEDLIQKYIDSECSKEELTLINEHLRKCDECNAAVVVAGKRSEAIKRRINALGGEVGEIPVFSAVSKPRALSLAKRRKLVYTMSAACILLLAAWGMYNWESQTPQENALYYSLEYEIDANKPLTEQDMVMYISSETGEGMENEVIEL